MTDDDQRLDDEGETTRVKLHLADPPTRHGANTHYHWQITGAASPEMWARTLQAVFPQWSRAEGRAASCTASTRAILLDSAHVLRDPATSLGGPDDPVEPVHLHGVYDTSLHVCLPAERAREIHKKRWGEVVPGSPHGTRVMLYGPRTDAELATVLELVQESVEWAESQNAPQPAADSESEVGLRKVAEREVEVDFSFFSVLSLAPGQRGYGVDWYGDQKNGLVGAAEPGYLHLNTGSYRGPVPVELLVGDAAPPVGDEWEEIVEVSFTSLSETVSLSWGGDGIFELRLDPGTYRVRYSGKGLDLAAGPVPPEDGLSWPPDFYQIVFWPEPSRRADEIVRVTGWYARRCHDTWGGQSQS